MVVDFSLLPLSTKFYDQIRRATAEGASNNDGNSSSSLDGMQALLSTQEIVRQYASEGDLLRCIVHCRAHYSAALFASGALVLLCPSVPERHGMRLPSDGERVTCVAAGDTHVVYCTASGAVFSCGYSNAYGQLGDGTVWQQQHDEGARVPLLSDPRRLAMFGEVGPTETLVTAVTYHGPQRQTVAISSVACGAQHTLFLSRRGNAVYACGRGHRGQLGGHRAVPLQPSPRSVRLLFGLPIRQVAAAADHTLVLLGTGKLLACGDNASGQLGMGHTRQVLIPTPVTFLEGTAAAAAGGSSASSEGQRVLDKKTYNTLRAGYASAEATHFPLRVQRISEEADPGLPSIAEVACGPTLTVARTHAGEWLSCGLALTIGRTLGEGEGEGARADAAVAAASGIVGDNMTRRYDGHGVLGRPVLGPAAPLRFGLMCWTPTLAASPAASLQCLCYPQAVVVGAVTEAAASAGHSDGRLTPVSTDDFVHRGSGTGVDTQANSEHEDLPTAPALAAGLSLHVQSSAVSGLLHVTASAAGTTLRVTRVPPTAVGAGDAADGSPLLLASDPGKAADDSLRFDLSPSSVMVPLRECIMIM